MRTRLELHEELVELLGSRNVYFQPATNTEIKYPCIVYKLTGHDNKYADNKRYVSYAQYSITHIYQKYSHNLQDKMLDNFEFISDPIPGYMDGLYQDMYTLYY